MNNVEECKKVPTAGLPKKYHVGYTCGVFDLLHVGHLNLFENCKKQCDILIVGVCSDQYVRQTKHKEPVIKEADRKRMVEALSCVDKAVIVDIETTNNKMIALDTFGFDVLFSGDYWMGSERYRITEEQFKLYDVDIVYLSYTKGVSTTEIMKKLETR